MPLNAADLGRDPYDRLYNGNLFAPLLGDLFELVLKILVIVCCLISVIEFSKLVRDFVAPYAKKAVCSGAGIFNSLLSVPGRAINKFCQLWIRLIDAYNEDRPLVFALCGILKICLEFFFDPHTIATSVLDGVAVFTTAANYTNDTSGWVHLLLKMPSANSKTGRTAIITGGATVVFKELLDEAVTPKFLSALSAAGFETVYIQCGTYVDEINEKLEDIQHLSLHIKVEPFMSDMKEKMKMCRGLRGGRPGGVVISHAGTGTIADCWEVNVANIIVANPNLMDNHQAVFAEDTAKEHPTVVLGRLGQLDRAVKEAIGVIKDKGLDNLPAYAEPAWPLADDVRMAFIDNLIMDG
ncbi:unnamed protein product [Discula destructiva]